ncbi:hypothetical protein EVAR_49277_1 [Eumeta japonica]|uniref:Uncharacterized protein n=1 Tax=Eumeta variegata TaxID=151549 RepID=A0A4C1XL18_EUMVA|nr:hypothetical protein EVAR_49277_1 [Eumeta japonica]
MPVAPIKRALGINNPCSKRSDMRQQLPRRHDGGSVASAWSINFEMSAVPVSYAHRKEEEAGAWQDEVAISEFVDLAVIRRLPPSNGQQHASAVRSMQTGLCKPPTAARRAPVDVRQQQSRQHTSPIHSIKM